MTMNRRTLLKSAGATALIPSIGVIRAKPVRAASVERGWASRFTGNQHFEGVLQNCPASSPYGAIGIAHNSLTSAQQYFMTISGAIPLMAVFSNVPGNIELYINDVPSFNMFGYGLYNAVTITPGWIIAVMTWDMTVPKIDMWATGLSNIATSSWGPSWNVPYGNAPILGISGFPNNVGGFDSQIVSDVSYIYVQIGTKCNINDILDEFYNFESGYAVRSNGRNRVKGVISQADMSGPPAMFGTNMAQATWTWPGTLSTSSDLTRYGEPLQNSPLPDPFEPGSPV